LVTLLSPLTSQAIVGTTHVFVTTFEDSDVPMNAWIESTPAPLSSWYVNVVLPSAPVVPVPSCRRSGCRRAP
jgi:hypothetical protein